jgi:hypothetical protein
MNTDDFEKKLQRQPLRQIPGDWREAILRTAQERASSAAQRPEPALIRALLITWRELIQPCRYAWSGMAALWLIFWMVNSRTQLADSPRGMATSTRAASERIRFLEEQRQVLVELTGPIDLSPAEPSRRARPKPHSERGPSGQHHRVGTVRCAVRAAFSGATYAVLRTSSPSLGHPAERGLGRRSAPSPPERILEIRSC